MKPEYKKRWVEALRSGEYKQGKGALERGGNFCCLGVLCHTMREELNIPREVGGDGYYIYGGSSASLTREWRETFDLQTQEVGELIIMNDAGHPFTEIADYIEGNL